MVEGTKKTTVAKKATTVDKTTPGATTTAKPTPGGTSTSIGGLNDNECPVCLEFCAKPVKAPCKHTVCFDCSKRLTSMGMTCVLCRAHFDKLFVPVVDKEL